MLTVLFATRNGARSLPGVLEAYCRLQAPAGGWKLVVVDNASTDQSRDIITSFQHRLPLTCLHERRIGKNAALRTGLCRVSGDLVVFTDDDVFPRPEWLVRIRAAADEQPSYSIFGGVVLPRWEAPPPDWILAWVPLGPVFSLTNPSLQEGPTTFHTIFGATMAIRTAVFASGHDFDVTIGPRGASYAMGSETELVRRLVWRGYKAWHVRDAVVEHFIREFQMQRSWILDRAIRFGRGQYRLAQAIETVQIRWWGVPRYLFREMLMHAIAIVRGLVGFDEAGLFRARWQFNYARGQVMEARVLRRKQVLTSTHQQM